MSMPENEPLTLSDAIMTPEESELAELAKLAELLGTLSEKVLSDEAIEKLCKDTCSHIDVLRLLNHLSDLFDEACLPDEKYNRNAQTNIVRLTHSLIQNTYEKPPAKAPPSTPAEPVSFIRRVGQIAANILRYPIYLFAQCFGYLTGVVTTYTSLDRSFWRAFFPNANLSLLVTLPIDLIFISVTLIQFRRFEISYLKIALNLSHHKEIDPALIADRATTKVTRLINEKLLLQKKERRPAAWDPKNKDLIKLDRKQADILATFETLAHKFSRHIIEKKSRYKNYNEPPKDKWVRWGFNVIGGFLVSCATAFSFKYTVTAFATSQAIVTWLPWLAAALSGPLAITILTCAAVASALTYYASKRRNSPNLHLNKFRHNAHKINSFEQSYILQERNQQLEEASSRLEARTRMLKNDGMREMHNQLFRNIREIKPGSTPSLVASQHREILFRKNAINKIRENPDSRDMHDRLFLEIKKNRLPRRAVSPETLFAPVSPLDSVPGEVAEEKSDDQNFSRNHSCSSSSEQASPDTSPSSRECPLLDSLQASRILLPPVDLPSSIPLKPAPAASQPTVS